MSTQAALSAFMEATKGQPLEEGLRYAAEGCVVLLAASGHLATAQVTGASSQPYDVALWPEDERLLHRCTCPSWRDPCKHIVAVAEVLRKSLATDAPADDSVAPARGGDPAREDHQREEALRSLANHAEEHLDPDAARTDALEERVLAARAEAAHVYFVGGPHVDVVGDSSFPSRVSVRGNADGPHGCTCPDFEANRLHTCKHVERVRTHLRRRRKPLPRGFGPAARQARIYLHFGEIVEPRLFGYPEGRGAPAVREAFDAEGLPHAAMDQDPRSLARSLMRFGRHVEPEALAWLEARARSTPRYPNGARLKLAGLKKRGLAPYGYQREGALFLARRGRALLADEMGLGKTIQAILAACTLESAEVPAKTITVVCPASLRGGWTEEIKRWAGDTATLLEGTALQRKQTILERPRWLITHYEQVLRDHATHREAPPDLLILDEAQRAKGLLAKTARAIKTIPSPYLFALTGTPLENRLEEAYAIAQLIDQRLLPPLWQIDRDHFVRDAIRPRAVLLYRNLGALRSHLAPAFLRRRKEEVLPELPEQVTTTSLLPMHPEVEATYEDATANAAKILRRDVLRPGDLERLQRLFVIARRCCNGPHMLGLDVPDREVPKLNELRETLTELCRGEGRKVVVFSEWTDMTDRVEALAKRLGVPTFHLKGSVPIKRRPAMIRAFSETEGPAVFVSTDAGGVGLNLQAADAVVNLDLPWNPARLAQRIARVHRIGSTGTVRVILLVTAESLEERMLSLHKTKQAVFENIWSADGADLVCAPGGSGALRDMLRALVGDVLEAEEPSSPDESTPPARRGGSAQVTALASSGVGSLVTPASSTTQASAPNGQTERLAQAVSTALLAVAPTLPAEHRHSLATVFQAMADALADTPSSGKEQAAARAARE